MENKGTYTCRRCKVEKDNSEYYKTDKSIRGLLTICKKCNQTDRRDSRKRINEFIKDLEDRRGGLKVFHRRIDYFVNKIELNHFKMEMRDILELFNLYELIYLTDVPVIKDFSIEDELVYFFEKIREYQKTYESPTKKTIIL